MKSAHIVVILLLAVSAYGQPNVADLANYNAEFLVYFNEVNVVDAYDGLNVDVELVGPVFNDESAYNTVVAASNPQEDYYDQYGSRYVDENSLVGGSVYLRAITYPYNKVAAWESVDPHDAAVSNEYGVGMIGWGQYKVSFRPANVITAFTGTQYFYVNTLDGNWMNRDDHDDKLLMYVDMDQASSNDPIELSVYVYSWATSSWVAVEEADELTVWELSDNSREKTYIRSLGDAKYNIIDDLEYPLYVETAYLDVDLHVSNRLRIAPSKTLELRDSYVPQTSSYKPTYVKLGVPGPYTPQVENRGKLLTRSIDPEIAASGGYAVYFSPNTILQSVPRKSWRGIISNRSQQGYSYSLDMEYAGVYYAEYGVQAKNSQIRIKQSGFGYCEKGIETENSNYEIVGTKITHGFHGVESFGSTIAGSGQPSLIDDCEISYNVGYGVYLHVVPIEDLNTYKEGVLTIRNTDITYNKNAGVDILLGAAQIRDDYISGNGWRNGEYPTDPMLTSPGILADLAYYQLHGNDIDYNTGYGAHNLNVTEARAMASANTFGEEATFTGENCYNGNLININSENLSWVDHGIGTGSGMWPNGDGPFYYDLNAFQNPRRTVGGVGINIRTGKESGGLFVHNYWKPWSTQTLLNEGGWGGPIAHPILDPDSVRCGEESSYYGQETYYSENRIIGDVRLSLAAEEYQKVFDTCRTYFDDTWSDNEAQGFCQALSQLFVFAGMDSAKFMLEYEAFKQPEIPGVTTDVMLHSLLQLQKIYLLSADSPGACKVRDSLFAKIPFTDDLSWDSLVVEYYDALISLVLNGDTATAYTKITSLRDRYPDASMVQNTYFQISGDTSIYVSGMEKETDKSRGKTDKLPTIIELSGYPNPANSDIVLSVSSNGYGDVDLCLYDVYGRKVREWNVRMSGLRQKYDLLVPYTTLIPGLYYAVARTGNCVASTKIVVLK